MQQAMTRKINKLNSKFQSFDKRVWYLVAIRVINALGFSIILPFISLYLYSEQGVPMTVVGTFFLGAAVARAITQLLGGGYSDKIGRRKVMIFAGVGRALSFLLLAITVFYHFPIYFLGLFVILSYGFGAMFMPAADALISDLVAPKNRVEAYSYQRIGLNFGWAIGPAVGGYLASMSYSLLFLIPSGLFFIVIFIVILFIPDSSAEDKKSNFNIKALKHLVKNRQFVFYGLLCFFVFSVLSQPYTTMSVFAVEHVHISKIFLGYLYSINGVTIILFQLPAIKWINRMRLTSALALGGFLAGIAMIVIALSTNFFMLALAIVILTFGEIFFIPTSTTITSNWAPESQRGTYMGLYGLFQGMGRSFGPFYGGILLDHFLHNPLILWGAIGAVALLASFAIPHIKQPPSGESKALSAT
ncbi:MAG: MFS transporter [Calditrichaeota bacterium]|nr:MFS transporter [Calditrichota bacterium]